MRTHTPHKVAVIFLLLTLFCIPFAVQKQPLTTGVATGISISELAAGTVNAVLGGYNQPAAQEETNAAPDQITADWSLNVGQSFIGAQAQAAVAAPAAKSSRP